MSKWKKEWTVWLYLIGWLVLILVVGYLIINDYLKGYD